jgi:long-chain acyl-CoA synthetase
MGGQAVTDVVTANADTFPKLLIRNAEVIGSRPAIRHKDRGIWQIWNWAQVLDEVASFSAGLAAFGVTRGERSCSTMPR